MQEPFCPICGEERDDLGLCDPYCPVMIAEDDQARAEAYEILDNTPPSELSQRDKDMLTLLLYRLRLRGR